MAEYSQRVEVDALSADIVEGTGDSTDKKSRAKAAVSEKKDQVAGSLRGAKERIAGSAARARNRVAGSAASAKERARRVREKSPDSDQAKQTAGGAAEKARQKPWLLALGSVGAGFLLGMLLPRTRLEDEKIAPVAAQLKEKAGEMRGEVVERGKQVLQQTAQAGQDLVKNPRQVLDQGLGGSVQSVKQTAKQAAQEQGRELAASAKEKAQDVSSSG